VLRSRKISGNPFKDGFEPLLDVFADPHLEHPVEEDWLADIAEAVRGRMKT
jgi:hypothetical protein